MRIKQHMDWQAGINFFKPWETYGAYGWKECNIWCLRFLNFPKEGEIISQKNIKGFRFRFLFWLPFEKK